VREGKRSWPLTGETNHRGRARQCDWLERGFGVLGLDLCQLTLAHAFSDAPITRCPVGALLRKGQLRRAGSYLPQVTLGIAEVPAVASPSRLNRMLDDVPSRTRSLGEDRVNALL
jgi:hypothetical protein